ncbi:MAG: tripartite tricarboxylate transporter substrate binding protein [Proteobacteria bacterium]|nr:tripartite tricarboxylate transporter substrate binding protein [Burkholderiales bacterium]
MRTLSGLIVITLFASTTPARAQPEAAFPQRQIRMVIPFAAGGAIDIMARPIGRRLQEFLGQPVVIDNRAGAGGSLAAEVVARSVPDGYTLLMGSTSPLVINPAALAKVAYDTMRDFTPISLVATQPLLIVAHPSLPVKNVRDLVALARSNPGKLSYGSAGPGTSNHLVGAMLANAAGIDILHVPYKGGGPALTALLGGEIEFQVSQPNTMVAYVKSGRVRAIATTGATRSRIYPDVGTLVEAGYKQLDITGWYCVVGPAGIARPVVERLNADLRRTMASADVRSALLGEGTEPVVSSPEELGALMKSELVRWANAVKLAGVKPE